MYSTIRREPRMPIASPALLLIRVIRFNSLSKICCTPIIRLIRAICGRYKLHSIRVIRFNYCEHSWVFDKSRCFNYLRSNNSSLFTLHRR